MSKEIGEFSLKSTTWTMSEGGLSANFEGTATGFGEVIGTLSGSGDPGAEFGSCNWVAGGFLDDGTQVQALGAGTWNSIGKHRWQIRMTLGISDGRTIVADGSLDLPTRTFSGKIFD